MPKSQVTPPVELEPPLEPPAPFSPPATAGEWLPIPSPGTALGYPMVAGGSTLHVLNVPIREGAGGRLQSIRLDLKRRIWLMPSPMPPLRFGGAPLLSYVRDRDRLFLIGGKDGYFSPEFPVAAMYDLTTGEWTSLASARAPERRDDHAIVVAAGKLVVWGGSRTAFWKRSSTPEFLGDGAIYDPGTNRWTAISTERAPDARITEAVAVGERVLIWRGVKGPGTCLWSGRSECPRATDSALLDVQNNRWEPVPTDGAPATGTPVGATGTRAVVFDGRTSTGAIFDRSRGTWAPMARLRWPSRFSEARGFVRPRWLAGRLVLLGECAGTVDRPRPVAVFDAQTNAWRELSLPAAACPAEPVDAGNRLLLVDRIELGSATAPHLLWEIDPVEMRARVATVPRHEAVHRHGALIWTAEGLVVLGGTIDGPNGCEGGPVPPPRGPGTCDPMPPERRTDGSLIRPSFVSLGE